MRSAAGVVCLAAGGVAAQTTTAPPRWEAGLLAGGAHVADYPGADRSRGRGLLAPVFIYRGPVLRIDQDGVRGRLIDNPDFELDLAASAAFNARDNPARAGMPDLDYLFGAGAQLIYKGLRQVPGQPWLHLKAHAMVSTDFERADGRGFALEPELRWRFTPWPASATTVTLGVQPTWASRRLQAYFYEVEPGFATAERPAYRARAGYLGTELKLTLRRPVSEGLTWFAAVRALSLHGAANADSPLLRRGANLNVGVGVIWTPWRSSEHAAP